MTYPPWRGEAGTGAGGREPIVYGIETTGSQPAQWKEKERKSGCGLLHFLSPTGWGEFDGWGLELGAPPFTLGRRGVGWGLGFTQSWRSVCRCSTAYACGRTGGLPRSIEWIEGFWPTPPEGRYPGCLGVVTFLPGKEKTQSGERYYEVGPKDLVYAKY